MNFSKDINEMQKHAAETHQQVLDLIESLSDTTSSQAGSSVRNVNLISKYYKQNLIDYSSFFKLVQQVYGSIL